MERREFLKKCIFWGTATGFTLLNSAWQPLFARDKSDKQTPDADLQPAAPEVALPDLVAVKGGEPDFMFERGIKAFGGMSRFVKAGQTVVIKPNIGWNKPPEMAACTNPKLVKRIVEYCLLAGAKQVYVFDHPVSPWKSAYSTSGIERAVKEAGGKMAPGSGAGYFQKVKVPGAEVLTEASVHELILQADVFINVPVLKDHGSAKVTISMKNLMGIVYDRGFFHAHGLHKCIVDINKFRKPDLIIVDAYRVVTDHGPQPHSSSSVAMKSMQVIATDPVAVDTASARILDRNPAKIEHLVLGEQARLGTMNLDALRIKRITV